MLKTAPTQKPTSTRSPEQHAKALGVILCEEFDAPVLFQDARSGNVISWSHVESLLVSLPPADLSDLVASGRARVVALPDGGYRLSLPLYAGGHPILVGTTVLPPLAGSDHDSGREARRLGKWAQSVCDRLRGSDYILSRDRGAEEENAQAKTAWEVILRLDSLLRHLRAYKHQEGGQQRILQAVFDLLNVEALVWVPHDPAAPLVALGAPILAPADCRQLAHHLAKTPDFRPSSPLLWNDLGGHTWSARFDQLKNLLAFVVADQRPVGWVIALNKKSARGYTSENPVYGTFRHSDAALLTPFVALVALQARTASRYQDLKDLLVGLTRSLTAALDAKDAYTFGHSERVARISLELSHELGLEEDELGNVYLAGLLHDIGKIGVRDAVLTKPGALTAEEFEQIKQHVTIGYSILADLHQIRDLLPGVLYHHEHFDGTGYPDGLTGEAIPFLARILAVADAYDAMSTTRPYRPAMPCQKVEEILQAGSGKQWDKRVIEAFMRCREKIYTIRQRGVGGSLRQALDGALHKHDTPPEGPSMKVP